MKIDMITFYNGVNRDQQCLIMIGNCESLLLTGTNMVIAPHILGYNPYDSVI
jgi:hypothetical protein